MYKHKEALLAGVLLLLVIGLGGYYCPFKLITGIPCPGCGMTHALFSLLHLDIRQSLMQHALLIPTILCIGMWFVCTKEMHNKRILYAWVTAMIGYYLYRMYMYFPDTPMAYSTHNLISILSGVSLLTIK